MSRTLEELVARAENRVGMSLRGKYRLERLLGVGSTGAVYLGVHRNGSESAIKVLHPELSLTPEARARFVREGYIANRIGHPGVVRILDDDVHTDGAAFLVMELLEGTTLEKKRQAEHLDIELVGDIVGRVLGVLDAAHAAGVVHRDIKPDNVFLTTDGQLKLLDFGIARVTDVTTRTNEDGRAVTTKQGIVLGTPDFLAPEQAAGKHEEIDARTDLYSVGAMLFLLLLGQPVHSARSVPEQLVIAASTPARKVRDVIGTFDEAMANVVDKALAFDKRDRWADAREMQQALRDAVLGLEDTQMVVGRSEPFDPRRMDREPEASIAIPLAKPLKRP
jgi:serine/threonine protein kinase